MNFMNHYEFIKNYITFIITLINGLWDWIICLRVMKCCKEVWYLLIYGKTINASYISSWIKTFKFLNRRGISLQIFDIYMGSFYVEKKCILLHSGLMIKGATNFVLSWFHFSLLHFLFGRFLIQFLISIFTKNRF